MNGSRFLQIIGRALIGAFAGVVVVFTAASIVDNYLEFPFFDSSVEGKYRLRWAIGLGALSFAVLAVFSGKKEIPRRASATIQAAVLGAMIGILAGVVLGCGLGKSGAAAGIFLGGPLGAFIGGMIGFNFSTKKGKPGPLDDDF